MSAAAAEAPAPKRGNKKLIIIGAAVALLLAAGGGGGLLLMKKKAPADDEAAESHDATPQLATKHDPKNPPVFVPLDSFTVNLADRDAERYAQVGITLEVTDAKVGDQIKVFMPAIRNNILMALAEKSARDLMDREGKTKLAEKVRRETSRALGYEVEDPDAEVIDADAEDKPRKASKKKKKVEVVLPITAVHFSNFIIQ